MYLYVPTILFLCACMYTHMHLCIHIHTHTHTFSFWLVCVDSVPSLLCHLYGKYHGRDLAGDGEAEAAVAAILALYCIDISPLCLSVSSLSLLCFFLCVCVCILLTPTCQLLWWPTVNISILWAEHSVSSWEDLISYHVGTGHFFPLSMLTLLHFLVWLNSIKGSQWENVFW